MVETLLDKLRSRTNYPIETFADITFESESGVYFIKNFYIGLFKKKLKRSFVINYFNMENRFTFVRQIKLAVVNDTKEGKNADYEKIRSIQYHSWKLANRIVQGQFFLRFFPEVILFKYPEAYEKYKELQGRIGHIKKKSDLDKAELKSCYDQIKSIQTQFENEIEEYRRNGSIQNFTYAFNADEYRDLIPSSVRASLNQKVFKDFNTRYKNFLKGNASIQTYKKTLAVPFQKTGITQLRLEDKNFTFYLFGIKFRCLLGRDGNNTTHILNHLINNTEEFKLNDSSFMFKDGELFMNMNLSSTVVKIKKNPNIVTGIDLGVSRMATMVIRDRSCNSPSNYIERRFFGDNTLMKRAMFYQNKRSNINRSYLTKSGKGRLHAVKSKNENLDKFARFRDNFNKKIAHDIIKRSIANNVSIIVMEDLSGIGELNTFMKNWPYFDLQTKIENKAKEYGIVVEYVDPPYTSQTCPACGHVDKKNREIQKHFECKSCGMKANADVVGAINIANKLVIKDLELTL